MKQSDAQVHWKRNKEEEETKTEKETRQLERQITENPNYQDVADKLNLEKSKLE